MGLLGSSDQIGESRSRYSGLRLPPSARRNPDEAEEDPGFDPNVAVRVSNAAPVCINRLLPSEVQLSATGRQMR
jgi:hypothetical protein